MESNQLASRFSATLLGFAIGDALGMPAQFLTRDQIRRYYMKTITSFLKAHTGHASDSLAQGSYTDETQMMLATAESLIECGKVDPARQAEALLGWYTNAPPRTPMRANIAACKHLQGGRPWTKSGVFSCSCGAAVRMPPIGLWLFRHPDSLIGAALDNCMITHTEPRARAAASAVAYLVARLVETSNRCAPGDQVLDTADHVAPIDQDMAAMLRWVTQIVHLDPVEALFEIGTSADAIEAIPAAVYCFLKYPHNYTNAVLAAVNAGEASDSIAALTGCFLGALGGMEVIPTNWRAEVENADVLVGVGENLARLSCSKAERPASSRGQAKPRAGDVLTS